MTIEIDGKTIPATASGFLENIEDWSEAIATGLKIYSNHLGCVRLIRIPSTRLIGPEIYFPVFRHPY